jgi:hypothetical protein
MANATPEQPSSFWSWLGGPAVGAASATGILLILNTLIGKKVRPADDINQAREALIKGLQDMVELMTQDKARDTERIVSLTSRIDELEAASITDIVARDVMHSEIIQLKQDVSNKARTIQILVDQLTSLGIQVLGLENEFSTEITFKRGEVNE